MSMIEQQLKEIRKVTKSIYLSADKEVAGDIASTLSQAADTIEALSAKLAAANMERSERYYGGGWIVCEDRLPEDGQKVLATHEGGLNPERQVIEHIFKDGKFTLNWDMDTEIGSPTFGQRYMGKVIAWIPKPEPYRP